MERHKNLPVNFSVQQPGGLELIEALCLELDFILLKTIMEPLLWFLGNYISLETKSKMKKQTEAHKRQELLDTVSSVGICYIWQEC